MSSGKTHMLIGATAGVLISKILNIPLTIDPTASSTAWMIVGASTFLATLPDIDEPRSWISQKVRGAICLLSMILVAGMLWLTSVDVLPGPQWVEPLAGAIIGLFLIGPVVARGALFMIRRGAGGHRRLTHSFLVAGILAGGAWWLWAYHQSVWAFIPGALAYSIVVHGLGDIVTPAGLPLLYPLSDQRIGLPRMLARGGETFMVIASLVTLLIVV